MSTITMIKTLNLFYSRLFSYWLVSLTVGLVLGITDWIIPIIGAYGFWVRFITGLTTAAILLDWWLNIIQKRVANKYI
ncbi:hypothetical protein [Psychromonas ingrahamii]|uniref:hypothetical protein n=1 Tax=Psychromonas ingrahamii TaxID=357794 RepID=UPI0005A1304E|nr:hypothetical protein [Psychromonas ingrahamii]